jgi:hypothetical protein
MSLPKESSHLHIQERAHKFVSEAPLIDGASKRELTSFISEVLLIGNTSRRKLKIYVSETPPHLDIQKRAHKFVSEAQLIDGASKR